ncbi:MAG: cytochrome c [Bacteroidetes bacterium]|jgi:hypothetical protein|nr:cytochrome c [Bacteroidota bacterium]
MNQFFKLLLAVLVMVATQACQDTSRPNYQFMPNMYEPVGYETYGKSDAFTNGIEAQLPVPNTISRGFVPYEYENSPEGYNAARDSLFSPLEKNEDNLAKGKALFTIYCAVCHGDKGDGQGILVKNEKFLGVPSYADRPITEGSIYHVLMYGINSMGSHASQINRTERWQVVQYVQKLKADLTN